MMKMKMMSSLLQAHRFIFLPPSRPFTYFRFLKTASYYVQELQSAVRIMTTMTMTTSTLPRQRRPAAPTMQHKGRDPLQPQNQRPRGHVCLHHVAVGPVVASMPASRRSVLVAKHPATRTSKSKKCQLHAAAAAAAAARSPLVFSAKQRFQQCRSGTDAIQIFEDWERIRNMEIARGTCSLELFSRKVRALLCACVVHCASLSVSAEVANDQSIAPVRAE